MGRIAVVAGCANDNNAGVHGFVCGLGHVAVVAGAAVQALAEAQVDHVGALLDTPVDGASDVELRTVAKVVERFCRQEGDVAADAPVLQPFGSDYAGAMSAVAVIVHCVSGVRGEIVLGDDLVGQIGVRIINACVDDAYLYALPRDCVAPGVVGLDLIGGIFEKGVHPAVFLESPEAGQLLESLGFFGRYFDEDLILEFTVVMDYSPSDAPGGVVELCPPGPKSGLGESFGESRLFVKFDNVAFGLG